MSLIDQLFGSGVKVTSEYPIHDYDPTCDEWPDDGIGYTGRAVMLPWEDGKPGYNPPSTGKVVLLIVGWVVAGCLLLSVATWLYGLLVGAG